MPKGPARSNHAVGETAFAKRKSLLRKAAERIVDGLWAAIGKIIDLFAPDASANDFADWLHHYNRERPHFGYRNQGRRPRETVELFVSQGG